MKCEYADRSLSGIDLESCELDQTFIACERRTGFFKPHHYQKSMGVKKGSQIDAIDRDGGLMDEKIRAIFKQATQKVWQADPESRDIQQRLLSEPGTIDDCIIKHWRTGLFN